jgi:F420H(2)-dependent quinone reductase
MSGSDRPPVESGEPPRLVLRFLNPLLAALLRSPLHRPLSKQFMLLTITGRKSGRTYTVPVGRHQSDGALVVYAGGGWRLNLRGGARVGLTLDGRKRAGYAEFEEDPDRVAQAYKTRLDSLGVGNARQLGLRVNVGRSPTVEEIKPAVAQRGIATIRLTDGSSPGTSSPGTSSPGTSSPGTSSPGTDS